MKTKAFVKNIGFIILFYLLGTTAVVILLNYYSYTFLQVSYIFLAMAIVSVFLIFHYSKRMICVDCKMMNKTIIFILVIMAILLSYAAFDMMQPIEIITY